MASETIHQFTHQISDSNGSVYRARAVTEPSGNVWIGWLEFEDADGVIRRTGEETSQPSKEAVVYWASGLEPIYLEGALGRAK